MANGFGFTGQQQQFGGFQSPGGNFGFGGGQQQGGFDLSSLLGQLPGAMNPFAAVGAQLGGNLLSGLGSLLRGPTESQKRSRAVGNLAQNRLGQSVLDPSQFMAQYQQSLAPQFNRQAEGINRRLGLDSGLAQQSLARGQQSTLAGILARLTQFNAQATAQQDLGLLNLQLRAARSS